MCDYCDCRSHPEIAALSDEHDRLLSSLGELRAAVASDDGARVTAITETVHGLLHVHASREEAGVLTELRDQVGAGYVAMFEDDHHAIHRLLEAIRSEDWRTAADEFAVRLHEHIWREESDLFPAAHQLLRPDQWTRIDTDQPLPEAQTA